MKFRNTIALLVEANEFQLISPDTGEATATLETTVDGSQITFHHHDVLSDSTLRWTDETVDPLARHSVTLYGPGNAAQSLNPAGVTLTADDAGAASTATATIFANNGAGEFAFVQTTQRAGINGIATIDFGVAGTGSGTTLNGRTARWLTADSTVVPLGANHVIVGLAGFMIVGLNLQADSIVKVTATVDVRLTAAGTGQPIIYLLWATPSSAFAFDPRQLLIPAAANGVFTRTWQVPVGPVSGACTFQIAANKTGTAGYTIVVPHTEEVIDVYSTK